MLHLKINVRILFSDFHRQIADDMIVRLYGWHASTSLHKNKRVNGMFGLDCVKCVSLLPTPVGVGFWTGQRKRAQAFVVCDCQVLQACKHTRAFVKDCYLWATPINPIPSNYRPQLVLFTKIYLRHTWRPEILAACQVKLGTWTCWNVASVLWPPMEAGSDPQRWAPVGLSPRRSDGRGDTQNSELPVKYFRIRAIFYKRQRSTNQPLLLIFGYFFLMNPS